MTTYRAPASIASRYLDLLSQEGHRPQIVSDDGPTIVTFSGVFERAIAAIQVASRKYFEPVRPPERLDA